MSFEKKFDAPTYISGLFRSGSTIAAILFEMRLIDHVISGDRAAAQQTLVAVIVLFLLAYLFDRLADWCEVRFAYRSKFGEIKAALIKLHEIPLSEAESGRTQEFLKQVDAFYAKSVDFRKSLNAFSELLLLISLLLFLLHDKFALAAGFIAVFSAILFFHLLAGNKTSGFWARYMQNTRRYNYFSDVLTRREYAYERRVYGFSNRINSLFEKEFDAARGINRQSGLLRFRFQLLTESMLVCCTVFTILYFIHPLALGSFTLGRYTIVITTVSRILAILSESAQNIHSVMEYRGLRARLLQFLNAPPDQPLRINPNGGLINFLDVTFRYPDSEKKAIQGLSWSLEKGKRYGLVGVNGSGKTTLIKLMLGLYQPQQGTITAIDKTTDLCMVVFQDFCDYPMTIREFLLLGNSVQPSDATIYDMLEKLGIADAVRTLKLQLNTPLTLLTEDSIQLSKGQTQKLVLARAFLTEKPIVILDEPTANLDPISERNLYEYGYKVLKDKTSLLITHRLGAIRNADEILVMDSGCLVERGTHEELMERRGVYHSLFVAQRSMYEETL